MSRIDRNGARWLSRQSGPPQSALPGIHSVNLEDPVILSNGSSPSGGQLAVAIRRKKATLRLALFALAEHPLQKIVSERLGLLVREVGLGDVIGEVDLTLAGKSHGRILVLPR